MQKNKTPSPTQSTEEKLSSKTSTSGQVTSKDSQSTYSHQSQGSEYTKSTTTSTDKMQLGVDVVSTQPWTGKPLTISSVASSSKSATSSKRGGFVSESDRKSTLGRAMDKAKSKLSRRPSDVESLASDDAEYEKQKAKEIEKQRRKEEYERLGLGEKTKFGMPGSGGWQS